MTDPDFDGAIKLWGAVLQRVLLDGVDPCSPLLDSKAAAARYSKERGERNMARIWVDGLACRQICDFLGLDYDHFRRRALQYWAESDAQQGARWTGEDSTSHGFASCQEGQDGAHGSLSLPLEMTQVSSMSFGAQSSGAHGA